MPLRTISGIGLALLISAVVIATTGLKAGSKQATVQTEGLQLPIVARQLPSGKGVIPVELRCGNAELSAPNAIEKLPCVIKNNTDKYISAATVTISITLEEKGRTYSGSSFLTFDTFIHPDFREEHKNNLIAPKEEYSLQSLSESYDDAIVKGVIAQVDYVEFADNTALGSNQAGSRIIANIRAGAAKYRDWLVEKYNRSGKSMNAIAPLLEKDQPLAEELGIQNGDQQQGAIIYRNFARKTYEAKGTEGLSKYLKQTSTSAIN